MSTPILTAEQWSLNSLGSYKRQVRYAHSLAAIYLLAPEDHEAALEAMLNRVCRKVGLRSEDVVKQATAARYGEKLAAIVEP